jgi:CheY-like chemotaxis protein
MFEENRKRILLIEGNSDIQDLFRDMLAADYQLLMVNNSSEALLLLPSYCPDAIVFSFSIYMPYQHLLDYARHLYPICYFVFNSESFQRAQELASESDAVVVMPLSLQEFLSEVKRITSWD